MKNKSSSWITAVVLAVVAVACYAAILPAVVAQSPAGGRSTDSAVKDSPVPAVLDLIELVLSKHVEPPSRQEMILGGARALLKTAKQAQPSGLSKRVSGLSRLEEMRNFLNELWVQAAESRVPSEELTGALYRGILSVVPGEPYRLAANELKVNEQLAANRYIGIGIVLRYTDGYAQVGEAFKGSPAAKAGLKAGDLIVAVDEADMHEVALQKVVEKLRGPEGTVVTVSVRQPKTDDTRTYKITRAVVPRETVVGIEPTPDDQWKVRVSDSAPVGYLKIKEIGSSTVHELRQFEHQLNQQGVRALILDLRSSAGGLHPTVLLADALLDGGKIGQVRTADGVRSYEAEPDCLFRDWPLAVLVNRRTAGETEWLAAALQDRRRAVVVGEPTWARAFTMSSLPLAEGKAALMLATGLLERADGRSLQGPRPGPPREPFEIADPKARESVGGVYPDYFVVREEPKIEPAQRSMSAAGGKFTAGTNLTTSHNAIHVSPANSADKDPQLQKAIEVLEESLHAAN